MENSDTTIYYKIRNKENPELYVKGTPYYLSYDKTGRIFQKLGGLRTFLTNVMNSRTNSRHEMSKWEIVEIEMVVKDIKDIHQVISPKKLMKILKDY